MQNAFANFDNVFGTSPQKQQQKPNNSKQPAVDSFKIQNQHPSNHSNFKTGHDLSNIDFFASAQNFDSNPPQQKQVEKKQNARNIDDEFDNLTLSNNANMIFNQNNMGKQNKKGNNNDDLFGLFK